MLSARLSKECMLPAGGEALPNSPPDVVGFLLLLIIELLNIFQPKNQNFKNKKCYLQLDTD